MAERNDPGHRPVSQRPRRIPWMEYLRGCIPWLRKETDCNICRQKMRRHDKVVRRACCGEWFHRRCIQAWREHRSTNAKLSTHVTIGLVL
ncbi:hypothetical protein E2562_015461 [Oryza meyeriana var. granulata]|uniref:RING-type domain-containing protein n=1 Tax=Oryza meyeriana var. granulata TaxID=110450 RepID=A0A6G1BW96_9ORYZ|nr:hypothetical protein E2562_015461 [Oryza meyeriana var. granulata]